MIKMIASALVKRDERYLIIRSTGQDVWEPVGGIMIDGETLSETVKRAVFERTGLDFYATGIIGVYSDKLADNKTGIHVLFGGTETTGLPVLLGNDHYDSRWLSFPQMSVLGEPMSPVLWNWIKNPNFHEFFNDVQTLPPYNPMPELGMSDLPHIGPGPKPDNSNRHFYDYCREEGVDLRDLAHKAGANLPAKLPDRNTPVKTPTQAELNAFTEDIMNTPMDDELFGNHKPKS